MHTGSGGSLPSEYDAAIIGGGLSGAATAILLRRARPDLRVVIVESKGSFDRKVGESAIELSSWFLTHGLGLDRHLGLEHLPKYGLRFWFGADEAASLSEASELGNLYQTAVPSYHIDRAVLDEHVLGLAVREGVDLMRPARVADVELNEGGLSVLRIETATGPVTIRSRWIVDASGRKALLARRLGTLEPIAAHPTRSIWARYRGTGDLDAFSRRDGRLRDTVCARGLSTNHLMGTGWWVWVIPLPGGETSVGLVWDERLFSLPGGGSPAARFEAFLESLPAGRELLAGARRIDGDLHSLSGLTYRVSRVMGDGWAAVGDAAGFLDPFYSTGLDWAAVTAVKTGEIIARSRGGTDPKESIDRHNRDLSCGFDRWFEALYRDRYFYMGDAELMEVALRLEVPMYYFGVVGQPYRLGYAGMEAPFSRGPAFPFYHLMRFVNRRLAGLGRTRLAAGTWGRRNAGRRVLLPGFKLGARNLLSIPGVLLRLAILEMRSVPDRITARRRGHVDDRRRLDAAPVTHATQDRP